MRKFKAYEVTIPHPLLFTTRDVVFMLDGLDCEQIRVYPPSVDDSKLTSEQRFWLSVARSCKRRDTVSPICWLYAYSDRPLDALPLLWYRISRRVVFVDNTYRTEDGRLIGPRPFIPFRLADAKPVIDDYIQTKINSIDYCGDMMSIIKRLMENDSPLQLAAYFYSSKLGFSRIGRRVLIDWGEPDQEMGFGDYLLRRRSVFDIGGKRIANLIDFVSDFYDKLGEQHDSCSSIIAR